MTHRSQPPCNTRVRQRAARRLRLSIVPLSSVALLVAAPVLLSACTKTPASPAKMAGNDITKGLKAESAGEVQKALDDFQAATKADPADAYAYYDIGVVEQTKIGNIPQAEAAYQKSLLADSTYTPAMFNLAICETSSDPQGAITEYNDILAIKPKDADTLFNLGLLLIAQNQSTQGHADLSEAIQINPSLASRVPKGITP